MAKKTSGVLNAYRSLKTSFGGYLLGFGDDQFFTFYMADADHLHESLPDIPTERGRTKYIRIHKGRIFQTISRLAALGRRVALVARKRRPVGGYSYMVDFRSDE